VTISFGTSSDGFTLSGSTYVSTEGNGATLSRNATTAIYTYTTAGGVVYHFKEEWGTYGSRAGLADVTWPSGRKLTYTYQLFTHCTDHVIGDDPPPCTHYAGIYTISTIVSSEGYELDFNRDGDTDEFPGTFAGVSIKNTIPGSTTIRSQTYDDQSVAGAVLITDPMGRLSKYRLGLAGVAGITRPGKAAEDVTYTYDTSNRVASVTNPVGTTTYSYADNTTTGVRTTTVTDPGGHATVYTFNIASNRMLSATNPLSKTMSWQYDANGRVTRATAPEGNYTQYTYDGRGNVTETRNVAKSGSGLTDIAATANYDATCANAVTCNQPNWTRDAKGNQTDYTYDPTTGNVLTVTAPAATAGGTRPKATYSYTATSGVQLLTGTSTCQTTASCVGTVDEVKTTIGYNANLLPNTVIKGAGDGSLTATTTIGYDDVGNVQTVDGPLAGTADTTTYRYDADREQVGVISADPDGGGALKRRAVRTTYNDRGIATLVETGTVNGTADTDWSAFSSLQQVATTLDAADRKAQVAVTAGGTTYALTQYSYDTDGRLDCSAVRMKPSTYGSLPSACTLTTGTGDADRITKMTYDNADRVTKTTSAYGPADASDDATATYSDNGQVATATDANGNKTSYTYDGFDRLWKTNYPSTSKGSGTSSTTDYEQLGYDANNKVTSRLLRGGTLTINYTYDNLNRLQVKDLPGTEPDVTYGYDLLGRLKSAATSAQTLSFTYDALGRNLTQTGPLGTVAYQYDAAGRRTRLTWPDLIYVTYDYQVTGEMTTVKENGTTTLGTYGYDDLGRRTSLTSSNGVVSSYGYDNVSRLTSLVSDLAGTTNDLTLGFAYNSASQITSTTRSNNAYSWPGATNVARNYTANGLNQYATAGSATFGYDAKGNLTSDGTTSYTYDSENRMVATTFGTGATLLYDPLGRYYGSVQGSATKTVLYDGDQRIAEYDGAVLSKRYVLGAGKDNPLVWYEGSTLSDRRSLQADERGSITSVVNAAGALLSINSYDEYGIPWSQFGKYGFTGQIWIPQVGCWYYKARFYCPTIGRFMQTDPIG
jgi:YD repeat-containing protein